MPGGLLVGNSHSNGGIKIKTPEGQIEAEGGEVIINKRILSSDEKYVCEGTPREMTSKINEMEGGVSWSAGGSCKIVKKSEDGSVIGEEEINRAPEGIVVQYIKDGKLRYISADTNDQAELIHDALNDFKEGFITKEELTNTLESYQSEDQELDATTEIIGGEKYIYIPFYEGWVPFFNKEAVNLDEKAGDGKNIIREDVTFERNGDGWNFHYKDSFGTEAMGVIRKNTQTGELDYIIEDTQGSFNADGDRETSNKVYKALEKELANYSERFGNTGVKRASFGMMLNRWFGQKSEVDISDVKDNLYLLQTELENIRTEYRFGGLSSKEYSDEKKEIIGRYQKHIDQAQKLGIPIRSNILYTPSYIAEKGKRIPRQVAQDAPVREEMLPGQFRIYSKTNREYDEWIGSEQEINEYINEVAGGDFPANATIDEKLDSLNLARQARQEDEMARMGKSIMRTQDAAKRPSPSVSATIYPAGTRMEGNDGNMWEIAVASNGVRRWARIKGFEDGTELNATKLKPETKLYVEVIEINNSNSEQSAVLCYKFHKDGKHIADVDFDIDFDVEEENEYSDSWNARTESVFQKKTGTTEYFFADSFSLREIFNTEGGDITLSPEDVDRINLEFSAIFKSKIKAELIDNLKDIYLTDNQFQKIINKPKAADGLNVVSSCGCNHAADGMEIEPYLQSELKAAGFDPSKYTAEQADLILQPAIAPENYFMDGEISHAKAKVYWKQKLANAGLSSADIAKAVRAFAADGVEVSDIDFEIKSLEVEKEMLKEQLMEISMGVIPRSSKKGIEDKLGDINDKINNLLKKKYPNFKSGKAADGKNLKTISRKTREHWFSEAGELGDAPKGTAYNMIMKAMAKKFGAENMELVGQDKDHYIYELEGNPMMISATTSMLHEERGLDVEMYGRKTRVHLPKLMIDAQMAGVRFPLITPYGNGGGVETEVNYSVELNSNENEYYEFPTKDEAFSFARKKEREGNDVTGVYEYNNNEMTKDLLRAFNNYSIGLRMSAKKYANGGGIKTDLNELENTELRNVLISFWNDFFNNHIGNYLSIEKENYILSNIDNVFVIVRNEDKGNFSDVEKQNIDRFLSPYFHSDKKPLFTDFFNSYEIKDNKIIIYIKDMYANGGGINSRYLDTISDDKKSKILKNIADHYGISVSAAEEEVKDADAEMLYEYIANDQSLRMDVYNDFESNEYANGSTVKYAKGSTVKGAKFNLEEFNDWWDDGGQETADEEYGKLVTKALLKKQPSYPNEANAYSEALWELAKKDNAHKKYAKGSTIEGGGGVGKEWEVEFYYLHRDGADDSADQYEKVKIIANSAEEAEKKAAIQHEDWYSNGNNGNYHFEVTSVKEISGVPKAWNGRSFRKSYGSGFSGRTNRGEYLGNGVWGDDEGNRWDKDGKTISGYGKSGKTREEEYEEKYGKKSTAPDPVTEDEKITKANLIASRIAAKKGQPVTQKLVEWVLKQMSEGKFAADGKEIKALLEQIASDFSSFRPGGQRGNVIVDKDSVSKEFRDLGNWETDYENPDYEEGDEEDNDYEIWKDEDLYEKQFKDWASKQPWFNKVDLEVTTGEKNWAYFYITPKDKAEHGKEISNESLEGKTVRLINMPDDPLPVPAGTLGKIKGVDDAGHILVRWENGSGLSLIPGVDEYEIIDIAAKGKKIGVISNYSDFYKVLVDLAHKSNSGEEFKEKLFAFDPDRKYIPKYYSDFRRNVMDVSDEQWVRAQRENKMAGLATWEGGYEILKNKPLAAANGRLVPVDLTNATTDEKFDGIVAALEKANISARVKILSNAFGHADKIYVELGHDYRNDRAVEKAIEKYTGLHYGGFGRNKDYIMCANVGDAGRKSERIYGKKNISRALMANGGGVGGEYEVILYNRWGDENHSYSKPTLKEAVESANGDKKLFEENGEYYVIMHNGEIVESSKEDFRKWFGLDKAANGTQVKNKYAQAKDYWLQLYEQMTPKQRTIWHGEWNRINKDNDWVTDEHVAEYIQGEIREQFDGNFTLNRTDVTGPRFFDLAYKYIAYRGAIKEPEFWDDVASDGTEVGDSYYIIRMWDTDEDKMKGVSPEEAKYTTRSEAIRWANHYHYEENFGVVEVEDENGNRIMTLDAYAADGKQVDQADYLTNAILSVLDLQSHMSAHGNTITIHGSKYTYYSHTQYNIRVTGDRGAIYNIIPYTASSSAGNLEGSSFFALIRQKRPSENFALTKEGEIYDIAEDGTSISEKKNDSVAGDGAVAPENLPNRSRHASPIKIVIFKHKNNPRLVITVKAYPNMSIAEIDNPQNIRFPYVVGQVLNMGHKNWACMNNYLVNDEDPCPEKKIFGMRAKDIPQGHPLRHIYPGKFKADGGGIEKAARGLKISTLREELNNYNTRIDELEAELKDPEISDSRRTEIEVNLLPDLEQGRHVNLSTLRGILRRRLWGTGRVAQGDSPLINSIGNDMPIHGKGYTNGGGVSPGMTTHYIVFSHNGREKLRKDYYNITEEEVRKKQDSYGYNDDGDEKEYKEVKFSSFKDLDLRPFEFSIFVEKYSDGGGIEENSDLKGKKGYIKDRKKEASGPTLYYIMVDDEPVYREVTRSYVPGHPIKEWESYFDSEKAAKDYANKIGVVL